MDKLDIDELEKVPNYLSCSKSKINNLDIGKLDTFSVDLSKLTHAKIKYFEDKINEITNVATTANLNGKINKVKNEIPT